MAQNPDVRWRQRFENFKKALAQLLDAAALARVRPLSKLEQQGLIQAFEFTHELAWNTLEDFLEPTGVTDLYGRERDPCRICRRIDRKWGGLDGNDQKSEPDHAHLR